MQKVMMLLALMIATPWAAADDRATMLSNPLISGRPILFVVRHQYRRDHHATATIFQTNEINRGSFQPGAALKVIDFADGGKVTTLLETSDGVVRDPEVSADGRRIVFSMRQNRDDDYHIYEMTLADRSVRQITRGEGVSDIDPAYLPDGRIVFSSTRDVKYCQCNRHIMANLFRCEPDGSKLVQIGGSGLFEGHPHVMGDGVILYDRWEYVDRHFGPSFGLWTMNADGTNPALFYGNNAWVPGMVADARMIPGTQLFVATFGSCHDRPWGAMAVVDRTRGLDGSEPVLHIWPAEARRWLDDDRNADWQPGHIDVLRGIKRKYEDPFPLSESLFLCARQIEDGGEATGLFAVDTEGREVLLHAEAPGCFDPMPIGPASVKPISPQRMDYAQAEGAFYVYDVYHGTGMNAVPRGTIKWLRVVEAPYKRAWSHQNWNVDATQAPAMNWNLTNNKRILGDVPVEPDGSAYFKVPANTFVYFLALDENKMMVQAMRSGTIVQPGETTGCVGCHEHRLSAVPNGARSAWAKQPMKLQAWFGEPREFNYLTEVQPVFDRHCVSCHDYGKEAGEAINLAGDLGLVFNTSYLELHRRSAVRWSPDIPGEAKKLIKAVHDGPPQVLGPYAWGSHRSRLIEVMRSEHYDVKLTAEEIDRVVTWIDLNAPYYGSYATVYGANPFGRSPLTGPELHRLGELVGAKLWETKSEMRGSQVNFTRPALSPCLSVFTSTDDAKYREALAIIEIGQQRLAAQPREDMLGTGAAPLRPEDLSRDERHRLQIEAEAAARRGLTLREIVP